MQIKSQNVLQFVLQYDILIVNRKNIMWFERFLQEKPHNKKGECIMTIRKEIDLNKPLTNEQKKMLEALKSRPVCPDDDCPELTPEQLSQLVLASKERCKQTVTLRLSPQALRTAKALGKGYTTVLSRILESALTDAELIKHF